MVAPRPSRSNGRLGVERPRRRTVNYHNRQLGVDDSSDEQEDDAESEYETDTEIENLNPGEDIKPMSQAEGEQAGPSVSLTFVTSVQSADE